MKNQIGKIARVTTVIAIGLIWTFALPSRADVLIDATDFTVDYAGGGGGNTIVSNWVGTAFNINAPILIGGHYNVSAGNNSVTISNFVITAPSASIVGIYPADNESLTLLTNTIWNQTGGDIWVGYFANKCVLTVNGAQVTNTGITYDGYGSVSSNALNIINGGVVASTGGHALNVGGSGGINNTMTVTGTGSVYKATGASAGVTLSGGSLTVANGGQLLLNVTTIDVGAYAGNFAALVAGPGSVWSNSFSGGGGGSGYGLIIGYYQSGNSLMISNGGAFYGVGGTGANDGNMVLGLGTGNNTLTVTGSGSIFSNGCGWGNNLVIGQGGSSYNTMTIANGGQLITTYGGADFIGGSSGAGSNNIVTITDTGSVWAVANSVQASGWMSVGYAGQGNQLIISNGATVINKNTTADYRNSAFTIGVAAGGSNNSVIITGPGSSLQNQGSIGVGATAGAGFNTLTIANGGSAAAAGYFGLIVGAAGANNSSVLITNGGLLEVNQQLTIGGGTGNTISNRNGTYQFTAAPTITSVTPGDIAITDGTISFRATTAGDVRYATLNGMQFAGANTFMLNAASNTAATAGTQTYTFDATASPTNYVELVMVNGRTAYGSGNVSIGSHGSMLVSSTVATISGIVTNQGSLSIAGAAVATFQSPVVNFATAVVQNSSITVGGAFTNAGLASFVTSVGTFNSTVVNSGGWISDPSTNVFHDTFTVTSSGTISMAAGDVYVFARTNATMAANFVNLSKSNTTYNTLNGKFVFSSTVGQTQTFFTAGLDLGPGWIHQSPINPSNTLGALGPFGSVPTNNFELGTLEISAFSTVRVSDAFITGGPGLNDNLRGALYLNDLVLDQNAMLIVDTNVSVYFYHSNDWAAAGATYTLLDNGELHLLVPEPNVLLLLLSGAAVVQVVRRRRSRL